MYIVQVTVYIILFKTTELKNLTCEYTLQFVCQKIQVV